MASVNAAQTDEETRYDHHYCISLAHLNIQKLFLRISPEKKQRYLEKLIGYGKSGLLYVQGISDIEDKIKVIINSFRFVKEFVYFS